MPWTFLVWILCFCLQAALVGFAFYALIQLYDFEEDLLNNFDCAARCNRLAVRSPQALDHGGSMVELIVSDCTASVMSHELIILWAHARGHPVRERDCTVHV